MRRYLPVWILILTIILSIPAILYGRDTQPDARGYIVSVGDTVPDFSVTLLDGKRVHISELTNDVLVLNFFASWCVVCRKEIPHMENEVWQALRDSGVVVLGVDYKQSADTVRQFVDEMGISYPVALDRKGDIFARFARGGVTRNIVLNKQREIIFLTRLFDPEEFNAMIHRLRNELDQVHHHASGESIMQLTDMCNSGLSIALRYEGRHQQHFEGKIYARAGDQLEIGISIFDEDIVSTHYQPADKTLTIRYRHFSGPRIAILPMKKFTVPADIQCVRIVDSDL